METWFLSNVDLYVYILAHISVSARVLISHAHTHVCNVFY